MKLLIRGGSIPAGVGVRKSYVDLLTDYGTSRGMEVINRSRPKETSFDGVDSFHADIAPFRPDLLMLHFGVDDAFFPVYRSEFKENLVQIIRLARERFRPTIALATSQTFDNPCEMDAVDIYYRVIREVSVDLGCAMIPVHTYWAGSISGNGPGNAGLVQRDARYPNEDGQALIAEAIIAWLENDFSMNPFTRSGHKES